MNNISKRVKWASGGFVLLAVSSIYWALSHPNFGGERWRKAQADNVREAVIRWQIARHRHSGQVCFFNVSHDAAANAGFAVRFHDSPFVKPLSPTEGPHSPMLLHTATINGFVDAASGKDALHFWVDKIHWKSDARAEVEGGGAAATLSGNFGTFTIVRRDGQWKVTGYRVEAVE